MNKARKSSVSFSNCMKQSKGGRFTRKTKLRQLLKVHSNLSTTATLEIEESGRCGVVAVMGR